MKDAINEIRREFYHDGLPGGIVHRVVEYFEKLSSASDGREDALETRARGAM